MSSLNLFLFLSHKSQKQKIALKIHFTSFTNRIQVPNDSERHSQNEKNCFASVL
jgi:hypothetical protein